MKRRHVFVALAGIAGPAVALAGLAGTAAATLQFPGSGLGRRGGGVVEPHR